MKNLIALIAIAFLVGCGGGSSGSKARTTTDKQVTTTGTQTAPKPGGGGKGSPTTGGGSSSTVNHTPLSHGYGVYPQGEIALEFNIDTNNGVHAQGKIESIADAGFGACTLPRGLYAVTTLQPGQEKIRVHNYGGITINAAGPVTFKALIDNSLSMQNANGEWVMHTTLKLLSVGNNDCSSAYITLSYSMPTL